MASFVVMEPPANTGDDTPIYVRDGFHWLAFLFAPIWLLVHRLWVEALVALAVMFALSALGMLAGFEFAAFLMSLLVAAFIGLEAAELRVEALRRRGWREWAVVDAESRADAEVKHIQTATIENGNGAPAAGQSFPAPPRMHAPALGLFSYPGGR